MPNFTGLWTPTQQLQARSLNIWPAKPGAPTSVTATAGVSSASVAFTAPADAGIPATITSFTATSSPGGFTATGASSPLTVVGLTIGTAYTFTVTATNATGTGPASSASNSATPVAPDYIEDVFSTSLHIGNASTQTITNGIDLAGKGGLVWLKGRSNAEEHALFDSARGITGANALQTNATSVEVTETGFTSLNSDGFSLGSSVAIGINNNARTYVSWTFRKQAKFFDIVTWTGNGTAGRTVAHALGSTPGCIIVKAYTGGTTNWCVYHRAVTTPQSNSLYLNATDTAGASNFWNNTAPTSSVFSLGSSDQVNGNGVSYVAYLFAHDAGGFGPTSEDNVISCGSTGGSATLGWEPQWLLYKSSNFTDAWHMVDNTRGWSVGSSGGNNTWVQLLANASTEETSLTGSGGNPNVSFSATGFNLGAIAGDAIYIAIRRPFKVPTVGTSVYSSVSRTGNGTDNTAVNVGFAPDTLLSMLRTGNYGYSFCDRIRGYRQSFFLPSGNGAENSDSTFGSAAIRSMSHTGVLYGTDNGIARFNYNHGTPFIQHFFRRAPGFYDQVCYYGNGAVGRTITHKLGVTPELVIVKTRTGTNSWWVYHPTLGPTKAVRLERTDAEEVIGAWNNTAPTSSVITIASSDSYNAVNQSGQEFIAYLFATCPGVSKVGSYTGTAATKQIDCGFTSGARFVLIKRTDSTGAWHVFDTTRGIISGNDPYLLLNSTVAEEGGVDLIDPYSAGFELNTGSTTINASGGTYIFLAIA